MHIKVNHVDNAKMLSLISLLSKYDLFHVSVDSGKEFNATEIVNRESGTLEFRRLFATPVFTNDIVVDIQAIDVDEFICNTPNNTYKIKALHNKPQDIVVRKHKTWKEISDLMDTGYFSEEFTIYIKELDMLILAVNPWLLGELLPVERSQIKNIINIYLDGLSRSMQMSRSVCFQVRNIDGQDRIYAGIYDLEGRCSVTSKLIYDDRDKETMSDEFYQKAQCILKYAKAMWKKFSQ